MNGQSVHRKFAGNKNVRGLSGPSEGWATIWQGLDRLGKVEPDEVQQEKIQGTVHRVG